MSSSNITKSTNQQIHIISSVN